MEIRKLYQGDLQVVSQLSCFVGHSVVLIFREKNHVFSCLDDTDLKKKHTLGFPLYSVVQLHFLWKKTYLQWFRPLLLIFFTTTGFLHYCSFSSITTGFVHYCSFSSITTGFLHYCSFSSITTGFVRYCSFASIQALVNFYNSILIDYILLFFVHYQTFSSITVNACMGFIKSTFFYFHLILKKKRIFDILLEILIHDGIILMIYLTNEKVRLHFVCMFNQNIMNP